MKKKLLTVGLSAAATMALAQAASASLLIYEPFDYTPTGSPIVGQTLVSAGKTWNTAGGPNATASNLHQIGSGNLTSPFVDYPSVGNSAILKNTDNTQLDRLDIPNAFNQDLSPKYGPSSKLYYSVLLNITDLTGLTVANSNGNSNNDILIGFNNTQGPTGGTTGVTTGRPQNWAGELVIRKGSVANTYDLGMRASSTPASPAVGSTVWTSDLSITGGTHLVVAEYSQDSDTSTSTGDFNSIWLDPSSSTFGVAENLVPSPLGSATGTISQGGGSNFAASVIIGGGIAAGATPNSVIMDELRVGTTWADVTPVAPVPEPTSIALAGVGALGLLSRRRRTA